MCLRSLRRCDVERLRSDVSQVSVIRLKRQRSQPNEPNAQLRSQPTFSLSSLQLAHLLSCAWPLTIELGCAIFWTSPWRELGEDLCHQHLADHHEKRAGEAPQTKHAQHRSRAQRAVGGLALVQPDMLSGRSTEFVPPKSP